MFKKVTFILLFVLGCVYAITGYSFSIIADNQSTLTVYVGFPEHKNASIYTTLVEVMPATQKQSLAITKSDIQKQPYMICFCAGLDVDSIGTSPGKCARSFCIDLTKEIETINDKETITVTIKDKNDSGGALAGPPKGVDFMVTTPALFKVIHLPDMFSFMTVSTTDDN